MSPSALLDFETVFHTAGKALLTTEGIAPAFTARELGERPPAHVVMEASGFVRASGHMGRAKGGQWFYDHHVGQLQYTLTTPRTAEGVALHGAWIGRLRALHQRARQAWAGLPYQITKLEETSGTLTYIREGERDRSELVFAVEFGIPGALMDFSAAAPRLPAVPA